MSINAFKALALGKKIQSLARPVYVQVVEVIIEDTDFPMLPEWIADPACRAIAIGSYDRYADVLFCEVFKLLGEEAMKAAQEGISLYLEGNPPQKTEEPAED